MMFRLTSAVLIIFVLAALRPASAYKWVALKSGDPIPENAIKLHESSESYIGRVHFFNIIVPAEVTSQGAKAVHLYNRIEEKQFEVLVATEECQWVEYPDTMENVVRAGTAWDGEPIYIGRNKYSYWFVVSIYLSSNKLDPDQGRSANLICNVNNNWINATAESVPRNAIKSGEAAVARLLGPFSFVPGQVMPGVNNAIAKYNKRSLTSSNYQVLVGDPYEYSWKPLINNAIPDHAVVAGESEKRELIYICIKPWQVNKVEYLVFSELNTETTDLIILVKNVK